MMLEACHKLENAAMRFSTSFGWILFHELSYGSNLLVNLVGSICRVIFIISWSDSSF